MKDRRQRLYVRLLLLGFAIALVTTACSDAGGTGETIQDLRSGLALGRQGQQRASRGVDLARGGAHIGTSLLFEGVADMQAGYTVTRDSFAPMRAMHRDDCGRSFEEAVEHFGDAVQAVSWASRSLELNRPASGAVLTQIRSALFHVDSALAEAEQSLPCVVESHVQRASQPPDAGADSSSPPT